jgi:hypothetical protein
MLSPFAHVEGVQAERVAESVLNREIRLRTAGVLGSGLKATIHTGLHGRAPTIKSRAMVDSLSDGQMRQVIHLEGFGSGSRSFDVLHGCFVGSSLVC